MDAVRRYIGAPAVAGVFTAVVIGAAFKSPHCHTEHCQELTALAPDLARGARDIVTTTDGAYTAGPYVGTFNSAIAAGTASPTQYIQVPVLDASPTLAMGAAIPQ
jgi:hypothetical protein